METSVTVGCWDLFPRYGLKVLDTWQTLDLPASVNFAKDGGCYNE
jgi:hypothetical protein